MMDRRMKIGAKPAMRFAGAGALVMFLCWQHVQATRLGYQVESARKLALERRGRVATLRVELDELLSPEQVSVRAARLGLVPAAPEALRRLSTEGSAAPAGALNRLWTRRLAPMLSVSRG
jgi:hypothetical protein